MKGLEHSQKQSAHESSRAYRRKQFKHSLKDAPGERETCKSMKVRSWSQKCTRRRTSGRKKTRHLKVWRYAAGNEKAQDTRDLDARGPGAYKYGGTDPAPSSKQRGAGVLEDLHTSGAKQPEGQKYEGTQGGRTSIPLGQNHAKVKSMEVWPTFDL